jgi:polysaccharide export outer membrane protein
VSVAVVGTYAAVARRLRQADVLVCPRTSWSGFPIKVLNYMAAGRPIVQARGSAHSITNGVSGLLYDDEDPGALAKTIQRVLRDPRLGEELGAGARAALRENYVWPRVLPRVLMVYEAVTARRQDLGSGRRKNETNISANAKMAEMPQRLTRRAPSTQARRIRVRRLAAALLCAFASGCARQHTEIVAPLPPISAPAVPGSAESAGRYLISPGDQLRVKFLYHPELDVKLPVGPDGRIEVQGIGSLEAEGKTAEELAADLVVLSSATLRDPEVTVIVAEMGLRQVYVMGEVRLPGPVQYRDGMTPLQAIIDRGGFTEVAQLDSVLHLTPNEGTYDAKRLDFSREIGANGPELAHLGVYDIIHVPRTFIGDANAVVRLYIRGLLPTMPRVGIGFSP